MHQTSSLCSSMASLMCLPVISYDFLKFVRLKICLHPWETYSFTLLRPIWEIIPETMSLYKLEGSTEAWRTVLKLGDLM